MTIRLTLNSALLAAIGVSVLVGVVPTGIALDRRLAASLIERARQDIAVAPQLVADRNSAFSDALMMHAKELAHAPGLAAAVARRDRGGILSSIEAVRATLGAAAPLVVTPDSAMNLGLTPDSALVAQTKLGKMPVTLWTDGAIIRNMALAPLEHEGRWVGAAGVATPLDDEEVIGLKGVSRSDVILASALGHSVTATTLDADLARALLASVLTEPSATRVRELEVGGAHYIVVRAPLADAGSAIFVRSVAQELQVLPALRRTAALAAAAAVSLALLLGAWLARRISRPARQLAAAAHAMGAGAFDTELPDSRIVEISAVAERFEEMRRALEARLVELRDSNSALQDRSARLVALQSDLMQRERLAAAGRLVAQLAHEIRNPVASLRNCLEVVRRRVAHDAEGVEFADLAINELLRMHELAEQMLDVSRPRPSAVARCAPVQVARDVVRLMTAGIPERDLLVEITGDTALPAAIAGDALKQVLLNLVQNAREAVATSAGEAGGARVWIRVGRSDEGITVVLDDNGPGVAPECRDRVFDPFYSTKTDLHGVGLGLFVAEGLMRNAGGRMSVGEAPGGGARFTLHLPVATTDGALAAPGAQREVPVAP